MKKVCVLPGQLTALEHCVKQDYFPVDQANVLEIFLSRLVHVYSDLLTKVEKPLFSISCFSCCVFLFQKWQSLGILFQC